MSLEVFTPTPSPEDKPSIPIKESLKVVAEATNVHYSRVLAIYTYLRRSKHISPHEISKKDKPTRLGLDQDQMQFVERIVQFVADNNIGDFSRKHNRERISPLLTPQQPAPDSRNGSY